MIVRVYKRQHDFKDVASILLHGKRQKNPDLVAWASTHNLYTDDPEKAARAMAWTDENRGHIRMMAGRSPAGSKGSAGNVYCFLLSWAPDEDPSRTEMEEAGHEAIAVLGLSEHEYFFVAHADTAQPCLHVVASLVDFETGLIASVRRDRKALDLWAYEYELARGIKCEGRAKKYGGVHGHGS